MPLTFVGDRCCDHSPSSGYDQLCRLFPDAGWLSGRQLVAGQWRWHRRPAAGAGDRHTFHVFYGDCSGHELPGFLRARYPQAAIISSVHRPVSLLVENPGALASCHHADVIVAVSERQARELGELRLSAAVHAVPHGVWTDVFGPARTAAGIERCDVLMVGQYLRDWDAAGRIAGPLVAAGLRVVVVGAGPAAERLAGRPGVTLVPRLSERELVEAYDRSAALLLPTVEATASNALLEAMAAGCPVVCTGPSPLTDEYLGDRVDAFAPGDDDTAVARVLQYVRDPEARARRARALKRRVLAFDWDNLRERFAAIYDRERQHLSASDA